MAGDALDFDFDDIETHKSADSNIQRYVLFLGRCPGVNYVVNFL